MLTIQEMISQWPAFARAYDLDPQIGVLVRPDHEVTSFNATKLLELVVKMKGLTTEEELRKFFQTFPDLQLNNERTNTDMLILHSFMVFVVEKFMLYCKLIRQEVRGAMLPKRVAMPLHIASEQIGMIPGMAYGQQFNWFCIDKINYSTYQFGYENFELKTFLTSNPKMEKMFFGGSIIASFHIAKMIRLIYEMNVIIQHAPMEEEQVLMRLSECKTRWQKIIEQIRGFISEFDGDYFTNELFYMVDGFKDLIFEGVDHGKDKTFTAGRGSGGTDPSYQMLEKGFGIRLQGSILEGQKRLRKSMMKSNVALIDYFEEKSMIRDYCDCNLSLTKAYNDVLSLYSEFLFIHQCFIRKFFLHQKVIPQSLNDQVQVSRENVSEELMGFLTHYGQVKACLLSSEGKI